VVKTRKGTEVPDDLAAALAGDATALGAFERMSPSHQREYVRWIAEAKRDVTRTRRVAEALVRIRDTGARSSAAPRG
jgi:uncharacterized protein YdeI (YjbR/CyaY-like superfamily)